MPRMVNLGRFGGRGIRKCIISHILLKRDNTNNMKELSIISIYKAKKATNYKGINTNAAIFNIKYNSDERQIQITEEQNEFSLFDIHINQQIQKNTSMLFPQNTFIDFESSYSVQRDISSNSWILKNKKEEWTKMLKRRYKSSQRLVKTGNKTTKTINISSEKALQILKESLTIGITYGFTGGVPIFDQGTNINIQYLIPLIRVFLIFLKSINKRKRGQRNKNSKTDFSAQKNEEVAVGTQIEMGWQTIRARLRQCGQLDFMRYSCFTKMCKLKIEDVWKKLDVSSFFPPLNKKELQWKRHFSKIINNDREQLKKSFNNYIEKKGRAVIGLATKFKNTASGINGSNSTTKNNKIEQDEEE